MQIAMVLFFHAKMTATFPIQRRWKEIFHAAQNIEK